MLKKLSAQVVATVRDPRAFWTILLSCIFFAFAGPFGSFSGLSVGGRLLFWVPVFVGAFLTFAVIHAIVTKGLHVKDRLRRKLMIYLLFCAFFSPPLYAFMIFGPVSWVEPDVSFAALSLWVLLTAGTCMAAFTLISRGVRVTQPPALPAPKEIAETPPRLFRRFENVSDAVSVTWLTVNDHYVVVGLSDGSEQRLLMRFSDAVAEMDDTAGFITHRSHWVSQDHILGTVLEGRREMLVLTTDVRVPVSRTYRPVLVAAGVLPEAKEPTLPPSKLQAVDVQKDP